MHERRTCSGVGVCGLADWMGAEKRERVLAGAEDLRQCAHAGALRQRRCVRGGALPEGGRAEERVWGR
eukprot:3361223-Pleurochrysis_carterae.AAC.1